MKTFDWEHAKKITNPTKLNWLYLHKDKEISVDYFISEMQKIKHFSNCKTNRNRGEKYCPSQLKREFFNLKKKFGFFVKN